MKKCNSVTKNGTRCKNKRIPFSKYCINHQDYLTVLSILGLIIAVTTYYFQTPTELQIENYIDEENGIWTISIKNANFFKETGPIQIYRLEVDPDKPYRNLNEGLKSGDSRNITLEFEILEADINVELLDIPISGVNCTWFSFSKNEVIEKNDQESITVKISCSNCPVTGYLYRLPEFENTRTQINMSINHNSLNDSHAVISKYVWKEYI